MITLYTTGCKKCEVLEKKLSQKNIEYVKIDDINLIKAKKILSVPWLEVEGQMMDFSKANEWINNQ